MKNTVFAARTDGLGVRLNVVFNSLLVSELTGCDFKFIWPSTFHIGNKFHSLEAVDQVFTRNFISNYLVDVNAVKDFSYMKFVSGDMESVAKHLKNSIVRGCSLVPQASLLNYINASDCVKSKLIDSVIKKIEFSDQIKIAQVFAEKIKLPVNPIAIHLRSGDIVYGNHAENPNFTGKIICTPAASGLIKILKSNDKVAVLFGQEASTISSFQRLHNAIDASSFYADQGFSKLQEAMVDVFLMAKCEMMFAESSGLPRLASQFGGVEIKSIFDIKSKAEWVRIIDNEIQEFPEIFTSEQKAISFYLAYEYLKNSSDFECLNVYLENAIKYNPKNLMFKFLRAINCHKRGMVSEAEILLTDLFSNVEAINLDKFSKSRLIRMIGRKTTNGQGYYAFGKYQPFDSPAAGSDLFYVEMLRRFFTGGDVNKNMMDLFDSVRRSK